MKIKILIRNIIIILGLTFTVSFSMGINNKSHLIDFNISTTSNAPIVKINDITSPDDWRLIINVTFTPGIDGVINDPQEVDDNGHRLPIVNNQPRIEIWNAPRTIEEPNYINERNFIHAFELEEGTNDYDTKEKFGGLIADKTYYIYAIVEYKDSANNLNKETIFVESQGKVLPREQILWANILVYSIFGIIGLAGISYFGYKVIFPKFQESEES